MKKALCLLIILYLAGCATLSDARNAKGQGTSHIYVASFDAVWNAIPKAVNEMDLNVVGENKQEGYILAEKGWTGFSFGERVAVFVNKIDDNHIRVEVVSKKVMATNVLAYNWEQPIQDKLKEILKQQNLTKKEGAENN